MAANRITKLSSIIATKTAKLDSYFKSQNLPTPSLDADAPISLPIPDDAVELREARAALIEACTELKALMSGPHDLLMAHTQWTHLVSLKAIIRYNLDKAFPIGSETTYEKMSEYSGLNLRDVQRIVRHGIYNYDLFKEPRPGVVVHSALTATLATNELFRDNIETRIEEFLPAAMRCVDALQKWPGSEEKNQTGFSLAKNTTKSMYEAFKKYPERGKKFANTMSSMNNRKELDPRFLLDNYPWAEMQTIVDVGGSHGSISIAIARQHPNIKCVVQDFADTIKEGQALLPEEMKGRVLFKEHDYFTKQTVIADVYYFRFILHNLSDKHSIEVLRNQIPALRPGARVLLHERIMPDLTKIPVELARRLINVDIGMMQLLNARQRSKDEWQDLFARADERFRFQEPITPEGSELSIIEAVWEG